jgi:hypothetical protein
MEESTSRLFIASSELFSNFQVKISLYNISTIEDIIVLFKEELNSVLKKNNLTNLVNQLNATNFHIHSYSIEDILTSNPEDVFYICDHC